MIFMRLEKDKVLEKVLKSFLNGLLGGFLNYTLSVPVKDQVDAYKKKLIFGMQPLEGVIVSLQKKHLRQF